MGAEEEGAEPRQHWNFQHSSWVANAQAPDGTRHTLERGIKRRQKAASMTFQEAKALVYREIAEWADAVEDGMLESSAATEMEPQLCHCWGNSSLPCAHPRWRGQCAAAYVYCVDL